MVLLLKKVRHRLPTPKAIWEFMGYLFASPLIPSVPNNFPMTIILLVKAGLFPEQGQRYENSPATFLHKVFTTLSSHCTPAARTSGGSAFIV